jgi:hypothetical protein
MQSTLRDDLERFNPKGDQMVSFFCPSGFMAFSKSLEKSLSPEMWNITDCIFSNEPNIQPPTPTPPPRVAEFTHQNQAFKRFSESSPR